MSAAANARFAGSRPSSRQAGRVVVRVPPIARPEAGQSDSAEVRRLGFTRIIVTVSLVLAASAGLLLAAASYAGSLISHAGHTADEKLRTVAIGNDVLEVPGNFIRFPGQRRSVEAERLDLYMIWPTMEGYGEDVSEIFNAPSPSPRIIFATVEPRSMTQDMSGRLSPIYTKFLDGPEVDAGDGLKSRRLDGSAGYQGEELLYESGSPYPYVTRCTLASSHGATPYCLRDIHVGRDLMVTYRFHRSLIGEWMEIERQVRRALREWLRESPQSRSTSRIAIEKL